MRADTVRILTSTSRNRLEPRTSSQGHVPYWYSAPTTLAPSAAAKKGPNSQAIVVAERTFAGNAIPSSADFRMTGLFVVIRIMTIGIRTPSTITTAPVSFFDRAAAPSHPLAAQLAGQHDHAPVTVAARSAVS